MNRRSRRAAALTSAGVALLVALAAPASAHVTVSAPGAQSGGGDQLITFRVPTESTTANTVGVKVQLPTDTPIASVLVQPIPGWTFTETTAKLTTPIKTDDGDITEAVSEIDWSVSAGNAGVAPEQFQEFTIIAGQLPDAAQIVFKAIQTYSDNSVVSWTDVQAAGGTADLDHPAPVLTLGASTEGASSASNSLAPAVTATAAPAANSSQTGAVILGIVALVVALLALGVAVASRSGSARGASSGSKANG